MAATAESVEAPQLPAPVARRGITEEAWRTAMSSLFPGAKPESVLMVFDYCKARKLDPLKKPCHIVPMKVKVNDDYVWRDVVMPGIYEYRTTAMRTGQYMGHSKPEYGPDADYLNIKAPEWCSITVYRWNIAAGVRTEFPVTVYFSESVATKWKDNKQIVNERWTKAPRQMLTKCTEAAGLREAFPDELGGEHTAEEMEGAAEPEITLTPTSGLNPRGDMSQVDWELRDRHVSAITDILAIDKDEYAIADMLREYVDEHLARFAELYTATLDALKDKGIITKGAFRKYIDMKRPVAP